MPKMIKHSNGIKELWRNIVPNLSWNYRNKRGDMECFYQEFFTKPLKDQKYSRIKAK